MSEKLLSTIRYLATTVAVVVALFFVSQIFIAFKPHKVYQPEEGVPENYRVYHVEPPQQLNFCGERVPTEYFDVEEAVDREFHANTYWQSNVFLMLKRANRYFPIVEPILKANGIPEDFKYLMVIESGMMNVTSPAGASGFWQFMPETAKEYGLEVNSEVDERYHLEKATKAACEYLKWNYEKFQSWTLVAASFNRGRYGLLRALKHQQVSNYWELFLNRETARYISRILALKYIMQEPERYGFLIKDKQLYKPVPTYELKVDSSVSDWAVWTHQQNASYKMLRALNPWIRDKKLTVKKNTYYVKLPKKEFRDPATVDSALLNGL